MRFRNKPIEIDAIKFKYTNTGIKELVEFVGVFVGTITKARHPTAKAEAEILMLKNGNELGVKHIAIEGDWIIRVGACDFMSCKPEMFEQTYDKVE